MSTELIIFAVILASVAYFFRNRFIDQKLQKEKLEDKELADKAKDVNSSLEQIKKEMAESSLGLKNMTQEQIENFWNKK